MRISTIPTLYGERVVLRFFAAETRFQYPEQLGLPEDIKEGLVRAVNQTGGAVLICGPAGSGKTTTAYTLLRSMTRPGDSLRSILTLEDPIEHPIPGTAQIEVGGDRELTLPEMIKYTMRQDPEVLFIGEIRDQSTAAAALEAALSGHILLTTFHAGSAVDALGRLSEMGMEPFVLRSSINAIICQRLLRRLCNCSKKGIEPITLSLNHQTWEITDYRLPYGCEQCSGTGYTGRMLIVESLPWHAEELARAILDRRDTTTMSKIAAATGMKSLAAQAVALIEQGITSPLEVLRVLGGLGG